MLPLNGRVRCIDLCIHHIVAALNAGGIATVACCCGHGAQAGRIDLEDGRVLVIAATSEEADSLQSHSAEARRAAADAIRNGRVPA